jgi:hypothetical protein
MRLAFSLTWPTAQVLLDRSCKARPLDWPDSDHIQLIQLLLTGILLLAPDLRGVQWDVLPGPFLPSSAHAGQI